MCALTRNILHNRFLLQNDVNLVMVRVAAAPQCSRWSFTWCSVFSIMSGYHVCFKLGQRTGSSHTGWLLPRSSGTTSQGNYKRTREVEVWYHAWHHILIYDAIFDLVYNVCLYIYIYIYIYKIISFQIGRRGFKLAGHCLWSQLDTQQNLMLWWICFSNEHNHGPAGLLSAIQNPPITAEFPRGDLSFMIGFSAKCRP